MAAGRDTQIEGVTGSGADDCPGWRRQAPINCRNRRWLEASNLTQGRIILEILGFCMAVGRTPISAKIRIDFS